ncbi:hypothetical protein ACWGQT_32425 [Streptomyces yangpuensis]
MSVGRRERVLLVVREPLGNAVRHTVGQSVRGVRAVRRPTHLRAA